MSETNETKKPNETKLELPWWFDTDTHITGSTDCCLGYNCDCGGVIHKWEEDSSVGNNRYETFCDRCGEGDSDYYSDPSD